MEDAHISRRSFLKSAAMAAIALPAIGSMSACSSPDAATTNEVAANNAAPEQPTAASNAAAAASSTAVTGSVLVAYYSATGNTERVANQIAAQLGADAFAITPAEPYSTEDLDWTQDGSRVNREHDDESLRDISLTQVTPDGFSGYDTVFIGYPIWWAIAAWPVDGFVEGNDFAGKTVIPFCTSTSSGIGSSATNLEEMANSGTWLPGERFASSADEAAVAAWLGSLGM